MRGIGRLMPFTTLAFLLGSLSIIGLPPFGGSVSKWYLGLGAVEAGHPLFMIVLMISSLLNIAYLIPIAIQGFYFAPSEEDLKHGYKEAPLMCVVPLCITAIGGILLFVFSNQIHDVLLPIVQGVTT